MPKSDPLAEIRQKLASEVTGPELDALRADGVARVEAMEAFTQSLEWQTMYERLERRGATLTVSLTGLHRRLGRPGTEPVTLEQIAYLRGQLDEVELLMKFPTTAIAYWRQEIAHLNDLASGPR